MFGLVLSSEGFVEGILSGHQDYDIALYLKKVKEKKKPQVDRL